MEIKAHFTDIGETIQDELNSSQTSITAAIAWLTDPFLKNSRTACLNFGIDILIHLKKGIKAYYQLLGCDFNPSDKSLLLGTSELYFTFSPHFPFLGLICCWTPRN